MTKALLVFFLFTLTSLTISAQEINLTGKVVDKMTKDPVENAIISVYNKKNIVFNAVSDSAGTFNIPVVFYRKASSIKIHVLSYSDLEIVDIPKIDTAGKKDHFLGIYKISPKSTELKEVSVRSRRRYSDTSRIDLSKEKFEHSVMVEDIFAAGFGFSRDANGQLYYKGKPISNILVNSGDFFGKNNMDVYHLLPALSLDNIQVVETNIDSVTNTTLLRPILKVNLTFKDKYQKGKFGNLNAGAGTAQRYLANTNLFAYKKQEQISLSVNSNNVNAGDNTVQQPRVSFSPNGNNLTTNSARFTYRNVYADKIEVNFSVAGKTDIKNIFSETYVRQETINLSSHTFNSSNIRSFNVNDSKFGVVYKIDSFSRITITQTFDHSKIRGSDSLNYDMELDSQSTISQLNKTRNVTTDLLSTKAEYQKKFPSKKGRSFNMGIELNYNHYNVGEFDNTSNSSGQGTDKYFINRNRLARENAYTINSGFIEPITNDSYINLFARYKKEKLDYNTLPNSDTTINNFDNPSLLTNNYFQPGIKFQKTLAKVSIHVAISEVLDIRNIQQLRDNNNVSFVNPDFDLNVDYKINKDKSLIFGCSDKANYPRLQQLVALNSTLDLVSQTWGNIYLRPEERKNIKVDYTTSPSNSESIAISGEYDRYSDKFGYVMNYSSGSPTQNMLTGNIGNSNGGRISFSYLKNLRDGQYLFYYNGVGYQENPTLVNNKKVLDNSITFNQSFSASITLIKPLLSLKPLVAFSWGRYFYETNSADITTITNSDQVSARFKTLELNLYPLFSYSHSINNNSSFSMNGELKKTIFKNYGAIWIQAYDIFNSYKFYNSYVGPSGYQSVRYSNLQRYFMLGVSLQFNNLK
jgi:hypothetical protein